MNFTEYWLALDTTRVPLRATRPHNMCLYRPYILFIGCNRAYFAFKGCNRNYFAYNTKQGTSISWVMYCLHPGLLLWITCLRITYKYRPCILYIGCNMAYFAYKSCIGVYFTYQYRVLLVIGPITSYIEYTGPIHVPSIMLEIQFTV